MFKRCFLLVLFLVSVCAFSQTLSGKVIDKKTGAPVEDASVFIENSSVGTTTEKDGSFHLTLPENLQSKIIVSAFGYAFYVISSPKPQENLVISLSLDENEMAEMVIDANVFTRKEMLKAFRHFFLGKTQNGKKARILNEKDISLYFDTQTNTLSAFTDKPVEIENKNLGYKVRFHLEAFSVTFKFKTLEPRQYTNNVFYGYSQFFDTAKGESGKRKNRQKTYQESAAHFFKELAENTLDDTNFLIYTNGFPITVSDYFQSSEYERGYRITILKKPTRKRPKVTLTAISGGSNLNLNSNSEYEEIEIPFNVMSHKTRNASTLYIKSATIDIDKNGNLHNPESVFFSGYFGDLKVADMLPVDYQP